MPDPLSAGVGIFTLQGRGQVDGTVTPLQVTLVDFPNLLQVRLDRLNQAFGQHGDSILGAFPIANDDVLVLIIDILDAQTQTFEQPQSAAIEQLNRQAVFGRHALDDCSGFLFGQHGRYPLRPLGWCCVDRFDVDVYVEHIPVKEEDTAEGLILGRGGYFLVDGKMGQESFNFGRAHVLGVALFVKEYVTLDPVDIGILGADGVMLAPQGVTHAIEQFGIFCHDI